MDLFIGGQHGVATLVTYSGRVLRLWAERGMVHMEDSRDNSYKVLTVRNALFHLAGINDMIGASIADSQLGYADELALHQRFIKDCEEVMKKAQVQGMPSDPTAVRDVNRRRAKSISVPGMD